MDPKEAIERGLHVGGFRTPLGGPGYRKPREVLEDGSIVIRDSDCEPSRSEQVWPREKWYRAVEKGGLWRKVGMWSFILWDDPAAGEIAFAHRCPGTAGRELYRLKERLRRLGWVRKLYDRAVRAEVEAGARFLFGSRDGRAENDPELSRCIERVLRIRKWLP